MQAQHTSVKTFALLLAAALLLVVPVHAQTLKSSTTQVTVGQIIGCNDSQVINLTSTSTAITLTATVVYQGNNVDGAWLYVRDLSTRNTTTGNGSPALTSTVPSGASGLNLQIGLNTAVLGQLGDTATVQLSTTSPSGQTINVTVTYNPNLACPGETADNGTIGVNPASLILTASQGTSQTLYVIVTNVTSTSVTVYPNVGINSPFSLGSGTITLLPGQQFLLSVTGNAGTLAPGTYTGTLSIVTPSGVPVSVALTLIVTSGGGGYGGPVTAVAAVPAVLNFTYTPGLINPSSQTVVITNANVPTSNYPPPPSIPFTVAVTTYNGAGWLSTNWAPGAQTLFNLQVSVNPLGLKAGQNYQGALLINPLNGPPVLINVNFGVTQPPVVTASPSSLKFIYTPGGTVPPFQTIQVTGAGGPGAFSVATVSGNWLQAAPDSGATYRSGVPVSVYVSVNPTGLNSGTTYTGTITVTGSGPSTGVANVAVSFTIAGPGITQTSNAASYFTGSVSPGEIISLFGTEDNPIGPEAGVQLTGDMIVNNRLPTTMGGVQVIFQPGKITAPLIYTGATQVNCQVPYEMAGQDNVTVQVSYGGMTSLPYPLRMVATQPGMFTADASGIGQALSAVYDSHGAYLGLNSPSNPVTRGNIITLYVTGEGITSQPVTGGVTTMQALAPYTPQPRALPAVLIDGQPATIAFYGEAPGSMTGLMQLNVIVPPGVRTGAGILVSVSVGAGYSQAGVTITTQ